MAVLFISHSSKDDVVASALEAWLRSNGFLDIFIDHQSILGGDSWRQALQSAAGTCRVVLCLVTQNWLLSKECMAEFDTGFYMGKRIFPLFLIPDEEHLDEEATNRLRQVRSYYQGISVISCLKSNGILDIDANLNIGAQIKAALREAGALSEVGLDPEAFAIDRNIRPIPFPGLGSFGDDDADAAIFYSRSREVAEALEELRKMRAERDLRPFVILGASGAGKSSLLKAGIIPRLRREGPAWLPLRVFRPGADPLLNFAEALARTAVDFGRPEAAGVIRDRLLMAWLNAERDKDGLSEAGYRSLEAVVMGEGRRLRAASGRSNATILVSIDQAEELARSEIESGEALADYLRVVLQTQTDRWQIAFTIRTDSFPELQGHRHFQNLRARGYDLRALPVFRFEGVVEEPARRYGVEISPALVDALIEDAPKDDALPLLAFALQRLWRQYAASGILTKDNYDKVGGLTGLIEDAAERALHGLVPDRDVPLPSAQPSKERLSLAASTFVPALAELNELGIPIKRVARWSTFHAEQRELLSKFDQWRLVVRKGTDAEGGTIEVAHDALFRVWGRLRNWLEPERTRLETLRSLQNDAQTWDRHGRNHLFLNHRDGRLAGARALAGIESYSRRLTKNDLDYLAACRRAETQARYRTMKARALVGLLLFVIVTAFAGLWYQQMLKEQLFWFAYVRGHTLSSAYEKTAVPLEGSFRECAKCPEMIVVPAGNFSMGGPPDGKGDKREYPVHDVSIRSFAIGKFELTVGEWGACVSYGTCPPVSDNGWGEAGQPVINLTWEDAKRYVDWLSRVTGKKYRLLTEAEWEYSARAAEPTHSHFFFGNDDSVLGDYAWYEANSSNRTHPADETKKPNPFGLFNIYGNVAEWVEDCNHDDYRGAPTDGSAWLSGNCSRRVIRGGHWLSRSRALRSASRDWYIRDKRSDTIGTRIARDLTR